MSILNEHMKEFEDFKPMMIYSLLKDYINKDIGSGDYAPEFYENNFTRELQYCCRPGLISYKQRNKTIFIVRM